MHEFLARTQYKIVSNAADGDAVLRGKVVSLEAVPLLLDTQTQSQPQTQTGRATTMLVTVKCEVSLTEKATDKVLYHSENFVFRNEYEISTDVPSFFEEQDPALDRLAQDFARKLVAAVIENYYFGVFWMPRVSPQELLSRLEKGKSHSGNTFAW